MKNNLKTKIVGLVGAFVFAVGLVAQPASALTTSEITAILIAAGLSSSEASALAQAIAASGNSSVSSCSALYTRDLTIGHTGSDVVNLQTFLVSKGFLVMPVGVSKGYFGSLTQSALARYQASRGISPAAGYFGPITRADVNSQCVPSSNDDDDDDNDNSGGLSGGDGDIQSVDQTTLGTETTLGEGKTENVLGFNVEADDNSDLEISSVRVEIGAGDMGSTRLNRYLDEVAIMLDDEEVGSVDVDEFSRDGATSTVTISLDDAIIRSGEEGRFYVALTAADSINDSDLDNTLTVSIDRIRFEDANGAVLSENVDDVSEVVDFEDASANDDARVRSTSDTRSAGLLKVDENSTSDEYDILTFQIDVDEDSSDLVVLELPVDLEVYNAASTSLNLESLIQDLWVEVDGQKYDDFDFETDHTVSAQSTETVTATFTFDEGDLEVSEGDTVDAVVFVKLAKQSGNYAEGTKIVAKVTGSTIDAENTEGDSFDVSGTVTGKEQTLQISAATIDDFSWSVNNTGNILDFFFTVTAEDEDFDVLSSSIASTTSGTASVSAGVLTRSTGDADTISGGFRVLDGDTATFRVRYTLTGSNGQYAEVKITSVVGQEVPDSEQVSPTATININN